MVAALEDSLMVLRPCAVPSPADDTSVTVAEPVNGNQRGDLTAWMPGTAVLGETPSTPLDPVPYPRSTAVDGTSPHIEQAGP